MLTEFAELSCMLNDGQVVALSEVSWSPVQQISIDNLGMKNSCPDWTNSYKNYITSFPPPLLFTQSWTLLLFPRTKSSIKGKHYVNIFEVKKYKTRRITDDIQYFQSILKEYTYMIAIGQAN
ncbi:hypothetical protein C0J52_01083 [Blattella germanica]|nr:hypothetical protein C0J52_01083 [Blattella germanica]